VAALRLPVTFRVAGFELVVPVATWSYSIVYGRIAGTSTVLPALAPDA